MPPISSSGESRATLFPRRNLVLFAIAVATVIAGYAVLSGGSAEAASVILVLGYCVLLPLALII
jgi:hypothetical protein